MPRRRKISLGSGRIYHAKGARVKYRNAMSAFESAIKEAEKGRCSKAHDDLTIGNRDYGGFTTEFKHTVGIPGQYGFTVMSAPRMRAALGEKAHQARSVFAKKCMVK